MGETGKAYLHIESAWSRLFHSETRFLAFLPGVLALAFIWPFGGGWKKAHMMAGAQTPAARGTVEYKMGNNRNTELDIKVHSLSQPSALNPSENVYVVWLQPPGSAAKDEGQIKVSSNQQGELKTETPYKRFKIFVTAEENPQLQTPEGPTILSADVELD